MAVNRVWAACRAAAFTRARLGGKAARLCVRTLASTTPARQSGRRRHRFLQHHTHRRGGQPRLAPAIGGVVQPGKVLDGKAPTPFVDRHPRHAKPAGDLPLRQALGTQQDNRSPLAVAHRNGHCPRPALQLLPLAGVQRDLAANHRSLATAARPIGPHPRHFVHLFMRHYTSGNGLVDCAA